MRRRKAYIGRMSNALKFPPVVQTQTNWCWAAVTAGVSLFYSKTSPWTQCLLANKVLHQTTCCADGSTVACNQPSTYPAALGATGNYDHTIPGPLDMKGIKAQIDANRPVCGAIKWTINTGHAVVVYGYDGTKNSVWIADPGSGESFITLDSLQKNYQGAGKWDQTYLTKA